MSAAAATSPVTRRVRAYFAPVNRTAGAPTIFDPAQNGSFDLDAPPTPWIDLGWCRNFHRRSADEIAALRTGAPAIATAQTRAQIEATVELKFTQWGKLQMALACGSQQMNLLAPAPDAALNGSGGSAASATPLQPGSTATTLQLDSAAAFFTAGNWVVVDSDYTGQTGYVGAGVSGAYLRTALSADANYIRRISLNVARVSAVNNGALQLESALIAGVPIDGMNVAKLSGFVDREGGSFFQEWSGLFVMQGEQGDRVIFHYPRLQAMQGAAETLETLAGPLERIRLAGNFRALPVTDAVDGEKALCFRSYLPA